ncbi:MAG: Oxidoreductase domain protein [Candidatus Magasanikbacteria bacterium GW2011_GWC2_45_8]|uniref:Oxidoreductase domain protein n=1 Tax=Candidatus Magasanikbacteria bacterium GW2011_GWC2_45_8 TaxID=1619050 RepID=A0A0G1N0I8_9BACT|nr:MAG: Oxidoreductase domain protein [Candidatus Magasanikbacteria bacterium GW2011_GWC2_45_8]
MKKILIIGGGSIGKRHLKNLLFLGEKDIMVVEVNPERANTLGKEYDITVVGSIGEAVNKKNFDIVFVCTPSVYHLENALSFVEQGCDLFIEKPLSHSLEGVDRLVAVVKEKKIVTMIGSNWKFYPLFQKMKELLEVGVIGKVLSARCESGQYLPDWHPWEDYRKGYSANKELGGGILLDSHEFDYLTWFIGESVKKLACFSDRRSNLEIDVEDTAAVILQFTGGTIGEIHLDYTQRFPQRNFEFFGETGTILWDATLKKVILRSKESGETNFPLRDNYDLNNMYIEEVKHFLECIDERKETNTPMERGASIIKLIQAAKESSEKNQIIFVS